MEKGVDESKVEMSELVLPEHTNIYGNLFGGVLVEWIDKAGTIVATRHSNRNVVTASIDNLHFLEPIKLGDIVVLHGWINYVGTTSMEVEVIAERESRFGGQRKLACVALLTYVALDEEGKPTPVPKLKLKNEDERKRFEEAEKRKEIRLKTLEEIKSLIP